MSYILCLCPLAFILTGFIISCYKRYQEFQRIKNSLNYFRKVREYFILENKETEKENKYNTQLEPGNDFYYDEHGNVIYGKNYIGAPRRPDTTKGMSFNVFKKLYFSIDKSIRRRTLNNLKKTLSDKTHYLSSLLNILQEYENNYQKEDVVIFTYNVLQYVKKTVGEEQGQLSYFNEIIYHMYIVGYQQRLKYVLCDFGKKFFN